MTAQGETITVARPGPDQVVLAVTDADGANAWVVFRKSDLADAELIQQFMSALAEAQGIAHEQRDAKAAAL
jgi:hypothetical protein